MDVMDMGTFGDDKFNAIMDKGTLDSVLCGENSTANVCAKRAGGEEEDIITRAPPRYTQLPFLLGKCFANTGSQVLQRSISCTSA